VVLTEKLARKLNVKVGDMITVKLGDEKAASFKVTGITENYVYHYAYISPSLFTKSFDESPEYNQAAAKGPSNKNEQQNLSKLLLEKSGVSTASFTDDRTRVLNKMISSMNYIILVLIVSAGLLAFIVLYNLTNINVMERQREIATIKVLGFFNREVSAYIYRETSLLSIIGAIIGIVFGIFMHSYVVETMEVDMVMFGRTIGTMSFIWSIALTVLFSFMVNLVIYQKLKKVDMVESLKSVD
jgi:putative ABC transport system permease protein